MKRRAFVLTPLLIVGGARVDYFSRVDQSETGATDVIGTPVVIPSSELASAATVALTIRNDGQEADRLIGGETPVAERIEVHQTRLVGGRREMDLLSDGLVIPPETTLVLEPGSSHLMLVGLRQDLVQGRTFPLTLYFSHAGHVAVTARVRRKVDAAGITPFPPVVAGDLSISLVSAPPAHPFAVATPAGS
jgi:copper(I)-binding protein